MPEKETTREDFARIVVNLAVAAAEGIPDPVDAGEYRAFLEELIENAADWRDGAEGIGQEDMWDLLDPWLGRAVEERFGKGV